MQYQLHCTMLFSVFFQFILFFLFALLNFAHQQNKFFFNIFVFTWFEFDAFGPKFNTDFSFTKQKQFNSQYEIIANGNRANKIQSPCNIEKTTTSTNSTTPIHLITNHTLSNLNTRFCCCYYELISIYFVAFRIPIFRTDSTNDSGHEHHFINQTILCSLRRKRFPIPASIKSMNKDGMEFVLGVAVWVCTKSVFNNKFLCRSLLPWKL